MDITYIPMARGFIYLAAVLDWFTRRVLAWRASITLEADFCIEAVEEALARHGFPEIFNTDQSSQFTSTEFIKVLAAREIKISMDGKGAWRDNVFVERLWRTIKYEEVYLRAYSSSIAHSGLSAMPCLRPFWLGSRHPIILLFRCNRPDHAGHLVRQRYGRDHLRLAHYQRGQPTV
jgi:transposase InsO family protein